MTHPIVLEALADARHSDLLRAAARCDRGTVLVRDSRRRRARLSSWLKGQLRHPAPSAGVTAPRSACVAR